jgi:simple sugar transport system permease protein
MQNAANTPVQIVQVLQALIVLFVIAPPLVKAMFRLRAARAAGVGTGTSRGLSA